MRVKLGNHLFVKRSKYIRIKNPLHKQSEKPACASKRDMLELATLPYSVSNLLADIHYIITAYSSLPFY